MDVEEAFWMYVDAVEALEKRSILGELENRYMEEAKERKKVPIPT